MSHYNLDLKITLLSLLTSTTPTSNTTFTYSNYLPSWSLSLNTPLTTPFSQSTTKSQNTSSGKNSSTDPSRPTKQLSAPHTIGISSRGGTARYDPNQPTSMKTNSLTCSITTSITTRPYTADTSWTNTRRCLPIPTSICSAWKPPGTCCKLRTTRKPKQWN